MITSESTLLIEHKEQNNSQYNNQSNNQANSQCNQINKEIIVVKIGGSILAELTDSFYEELLYLIEEGYFPVIIHGGGPSITMMLTRLGIESTFINGLRVTDEETLDVVQMVLNGKENTEIVKRIQCAGGKAIGLSGVDDEIILAELLDPTLGYVGKIVNINFPLLEAFMTQNIIPVISPLGVDKAGQVYNINADTVAQAIAIELKAKKILLMSDIPGIYHSNRGQKSILPLLTPQDIEELKVNQHISGGMIPKVEAALQCLEQGVEEIIILDGREAGILSRVINHQPIGTRILKAEVV